MADKKLTKQDADEAQAKKLKMIDEIVHHIKDEEIQCSKNVPENKSDCSQTCICSVHPKIVRYIKEALMNTDKLIPYIQDEHLTELAQLLDEPCTCNQFTKDKLVKELIEFIENNKDDSINQITSNISQDNELNLLKYSQDFKDSIKEVLENVISVMFLQLSSQDVDSGAETATTSQSVHSLEVQSYSYNDGSSKCNTEDHPKVDKINSDNVTQETDNATIIEPTHLTYMHSPGRTLRLTRASIESEQVQGRNGERIDGGIDNSFILSSEDSEELAPDTGRLNIGDSSAVNYSHSILCECIPHEGGAAVPVLGLTESNQSAEMANNHRLDVLSRQHDLVSIDSGYDADCNARFEFTNNDSDLQEINTVCPHNSELIGDELSGSEQLFDMESQIRDSFRTDTHVQRFGTSEEIQTDLVLGPRLLSESLNSCVSPDSSLIDTVQEPPRLETESEINIKRFVSDSLDEIFLQKPAHDQEDNEDEDEETISEDIEAQSSQSYGAITPRSWKHGWHGEKKSVKRCPKQLSVHFKWSGGGAPCYPTASDDCNFNEPAVHEPDMKEPNSDRHSNEIINIKPITECCYPSQIIMVDEVHIARSQPLKPTTPQIFAVVNLPMNFFRVPKRIQSCVFLTPVELSKLEETYSDEVLERHARSMPLISSRVKIAVSAMQISQVLHKSDNNVDGSKKPILEQENHSKQKEVCQSSTTNEIQLQDRIKSAVALCETQMLPVKEQLNALLKKVRNLKLVLDEYDTDVEKQSNLSENTDLEISGNIILNTDENLCCTKTSLDCLYSKKMPQCPKHRSSRLYHYEIRKPYHFCHNRYRSRCFCHNQRRLNSDHIKINDYVPMPCAWNNCCQNYNTDFNAKIDNDSNCTERKALELMPSTDQSPCAPCNDLTPESMNCINKYTCSTGRSCYCGRLPRYYYCPYSYPPYFYCRRHPTCFINNHCPPSFGQFHSCCDTDLTLNKTPGSTLEEDNGIAITDGTESLQYDENITDRINSTK